MLALSVVSCGGGESSAPTSDKTESEHVQTQSISISPSFTAVFSERVNKVSAPSYLKSALPSMTLNDSEQKTVNTKSVDIRYKGQMVVSDTLTSKVQEFDWPLTLKADGTVISHRTITLRPGTYDFTLLLEHNNQQYIGKALAVDVTHDQALNVKLKIQPHLGDTLVNIKDIAGLAKLTLNIPAEELKALADPKIGITLGKDGETVDELVFSLNKDTGLTDITLDYAEGDYHLALNLYENTQLVGTLLNNNTTINLRDGESTKVDIIPLQADLNFNFNINDQGYAGNYIFSVPKSLVDRVNGVDNLAAVVRFSTNENSQETIRYFVEQNGKYLSTQGDPIYFETNKQEKFTSSISFFHKNQNDDYQDIPLASCAFTLTAGLNQDVSCKLSVDASHQIHGHILGSLMLNVMNSDQTMANNANVYIDDKLVGITGSDYITSSFKTHLLPGQHTVKVENSKNKAEINLTIKPLDVINKLVYLEKKNKGSGIFEKSAQELKIATGSEARDLELGDLDGDGDLDLVVGMEKVGGIPDLVFFNDGKGKFINTGQNLGNKRTMDIALGDIDGDGDIDLVEANYEATNSIFYNRGNGFFDEDNSVWGEKSSSAVILGDINNDNHLDIIVGSGNKDMIYINNSSKGFDFSGKILSENASTSALSLGYINNDNELDLVSVDGNGQYYNKGGKLYNNVNGNLQLTQEDLGTGSSFAVKIADVDNDNDLDIYIGNWNGYEHQDELYINNGYGVFSKSSQSFPYYRTTDIAFADVDHDGDLDLITSISDKKISNKLFLNNGYGVFEETNQELGYNGSSVISGDIDNDGDIDLIFGYSGKPIEIYFNKNQ
ncbi:hypothetical protein ABT56_06375 [Photobacterium aquae]|uniref:VCBS repeat-containing protein n=2 Tax=Photobacterium aquae TaxID=1195763 RepID=A0A0J1H5V2_9GAMM|nr:hypothetical protein ABT56_06375 [Photobacterium aquae]